MSIFRFICLWVIATYLIKVIYNLYSRHKFMKWARGLFAQEKMPLAIKLIVLNIFFLCGLVINCIMNANVPLSWVLAVPLIFGALEALVLIFAWGKLAPQFVKLIDQSTKMIWLLEIAEFMAVIGIGFLAFFVY